jgi:hypothetical protein
MARIGYLYLNDGMWKKHQVLPHGWVKTAITPRLSTPYGGADYGYGWWLAKGNFKGVYEARGRGGQNITVWPQMGILLVTTGGGYDMDTIINALLPALSPSVPLPENPSAVKDLDTAVAAAAEAPEPEPVGILPATARSVSGRWFSIESNMLGLERLRMTFKEGTDKADLTAKVADKEFNYQVGLDGVYRFSETSPSGDPTAVRGRWTAQDRFVLDYNEITRINRFRMELNFSGERVNLIFSEPTGQIKGKVRGRQQ